MPKYLLKATYSPDGTKGLVAEGATTRKAQAEGLIKAVGGTVESMHFSSGGHDAYVIVDVPDDAAAMTAKLVVNSTGAITGTAIPLLTAEEAEAATSAAAEIAKGFRPPGE